MRPWTLLLLLLLLVLLPILVLFTPGAAAAKVVGTPLDKGPFRCSEESTNPAALCAGDDPGTVVVDEVVVINLRRRKDRLDAVTGALAAAGLRAVRFAAVDGSRLSPLEVAVFNRAAIRELSPGLVGNMMSHSRVWARAAAAGPDAVTWILEDDARFIDNIADVLESRLAELASVDPLWDMVYTGRLTVGETRLLFKDEGVEDHFEAREDERVSTHVLSPGPSEGMWGYLVSGRGARKLLDLYAASPIMFDVDLLLHTPDIRDSLRLYAFDPVISLFDEGDAYSDDSNTNTATNLLKRANKLVAGGLFDEALVRYNRALELGLVGAELVWAHTNLAYISDVHLGDADKARAHFETAVAVQGVPAAAMADTFSNYCFFLYRQGELYRAFVACDKALGLVPGHERAQRNKALVQQAEDAAIADALDLDVLDYV